jgi:hypothetical protein
VTPALLFVFGASGVGKTAAVRALAARRSPGVRCYCFDTIGVPPPEIMEREWGSGERWQEDATRRWIERLAENSDGATLAVLEGQTRPSFIQPWIAHTGVRDARLVLLDCVPAVRARRLAGPRGQPELATERMDTWAAYLRGQADALRLPVLDTSTMSVEDVADALALELETLRRAAGGFA